jgi:hypothetical protein
MFDDGRIDANGRALSQEVADQSVERLVRAVADIIIVAGEQGDPKLRSIHRVALTARLEKANPEQTAAAAVVRLKGRRVMSASLRKGQKVSWHWGSGTAHGHVVDRFERRVQRTIEGAKIVRNGSADDPAYLVETQQGKRALKRGSELHPG